MARRAWLAVLVAAVVACAPGLAPGRIGFTHAKAGGSITIAEQPTFFPGDGPNAGAAFWNRAAWGRSLFVRSDANPQVTFVPLTPLLTNEGYRIVAWTKQHRNADGSMNRCEVYYDPAFVAAGIPGRHANFRLFAHELGHCLELAGHQDCSFQGVMSTCDFWNRVIAGWGNTAPDTDQLRAAGYMP